MLTRIFNSNSISSLVILILMAIVIWAKAFINIVPMTAAIPVSPLYNFIYKEFSSFTVICAFIVLGFVIFEALLVNYVLTENDLIPRNSYLGAFIFVIVSGFFNDLILLHPVLIANLFIVAAIWLFIQLYEEHESYLKVFNIGTLISIASMFYFPSFVFLLLICIGFIIYRIFSWREWFISIIGFTLPYAFLSAYYFWNDCFMIKLAAYKDALHFINYYNFSPIIYIYIVLAVIGLLVIISLFKLLVIINEKAIRIRKYLSFMIWYFLIAILSLNFSSKFGILGFVMLLTPISVLFTLYIINSRRKMWIEGILITLVFLLITGRLGLWNF